MFKETYINKEDFKEAISLASLLHDIGKVSIPDAILNKPGKLTTEEFEIIKTHTTAGYETLMSLRDKYEYSLFINLGVEIAKSHHERWDGKGYPEGLKGKEIPLAARIVSVIDVYDALISERVYKEAFSKEKSIGIIKQGLGTQFDPVVGTVFVELIESDSLEELQNAIVY